MAGESSTTDGSDSSDMYPVHIRSLDEVGLAISSVIVPDFGVTAQHTVWIGSRLQAPA